MNQYGIHRKMLHYFTFIIHRVHDTNVRNSVQKECKMCLELYGVLTKHHVLVVTCYRMFTYYRYSNYESGNSSVEGMIHRLKTPFCILNIYIQYNPSNKNTCMAMMNTIFCDLLFRGNKWLTFDKNIAIIPGNIIYQKFTSCIIEGPFH